MQIKPAKYVGLLAALTILAIAMAVGFLIWSLHDRELKHAQVETVNLTRMLMEQTAQNLQSVDLVLQGVQERLQTPFGSQLGLDSAPVHLLLNARVSGLRHLQSLFVVDARGVLINSSRELTSPPISVADRNYFKVFAQGRADSIFVDKPVISRATKVWTLNLSRPLIGRDGSLRGVVVASIGIPDFEVLYSAVQLDYERPVAIYGTDGTLIASWPHQESMIGERAPELNNEILPTQANEIKSIRHRSGSGAQGVFAIGRLADFPLLISVTDVEELSLASWRETAIPIGLGATVVCIFTALVALYLIDKLQRKDALAAQLNIANDRYQLTVDSVMDAIVAVDESMTIVLFNQAAERMFGYTQQEAIGQPLDKLIPARLRDLHHGHIQKFSSDDNVKNRTLHPMREIVGLRADSSEFPIDSTISRAWIGGQLQLTAVLRDITFNRAAEKDLRQANQQLRELSSSLQMVREKERTRISRELHDDLGQQLTGLKLSLSWLGSRIKEGRETAVRNVDDMRSLLDGAIASVRRIASELRPRILDELNFSDALTWQTQEFVKHSGLQVNLHLSAGHLIGNGEISTSLFRITQEALTNVVRHAQASTVTIRLVEQGDQVVLSIADDGAGFVANPAHMGIGLLSMRERSIAIGASFEISGDSGKGTTIVVTLPLAHLSAEVRTV